MEGSFSSPLSPLGQFWCLVLKERPLPHDPVHFFLNWRRGAERGRTTRWTANPFVATEFASTALRTGRRRAFEVDVLGFRLRLLSSLFRTIQDTLKYIPRRLRYCLNPEDAVQNGRRHVDVNLLGMWWSAPVVVLCLRGMWR